MVGIVLTAIDQLDVIVRGDATAITWIKCGTNLVAVLDHGHRRVERAADVVRLGVDGELEVEQRLRAA